MWKSVPDFFRPVPLYPDFHEMDVGERGRKFFKKGEKEKKGKKGERTG